MCRKIPDYHDWGFRIYSGSNNEYKVEYPRNGKVIMHQKGKYKLFELYIDTKILI